MQALMLMPQVSHRVTVSVKETENPFILEAYSIPKSHTVEPTLESNSELQAMSREKQVTSMEGKIV